MTTQHLQTFPFEFDASKMKKGVSRVDAPNAKAVPSGTVIRRRKAVAPTLNNLETPKDEGGRSQQPTPVSYSSEKIKAKKRKRRTKEEKNKLKELIIQILSDGYDTSSLQILLDMRKDRFLECLTELLDNPKTSSSFLRNRQILPANKLKGMNGAEQSKYWEVKRMQNGGFHLTALDLSMLRNGYGISN